MGMNEYQEVLRLIEKSLGHHEWFNSRDIAPLHDLVDKSVHVGPPNHDSNVCPNCNSKAHYGHPYEYYCCHCGQRVDWGDEE